MQYDLEKLSNYKNLKQKKLNCNDYFSQEECEIFELNRNFKVFLINSIN